MTDTTRHQILVATCIALFSFFSSCQKGDGGDILSAPEFVTPIVTGIVITNGSSPKPLAIWGNPVYPPPAPGDGGIRSPSGTPAYFMMVDPYPNPTDGAIVTLFSLPQACIVSEWIVPAHISCGNNVVAAQGAIITSPRRTSVRTLVLRERHVAGFYQFVWDGRDDLGNPVPSGFYRIYCQMADSMTWRDVFVYRAISDIPPDIRSLIGFVSGN